MEKTDNTGFRKFAPPEIQVVIVRYLDLWKVRVLRKKKTKPKSKQTLLTLLYLFKDNLPIISVIWDPEENAHILHEIARQAFAMPLGYHTIISLSINLYRSWLLDFSKNKMFVDKLLQDYWQV